ncbi:ATP/GTP-binding protein [Streptomyces sp. NPDC059037]|uniref:GTP-binding protein n=1 Tax=Streptomyces sp. NPDC059037 TaxID=3346710 RepID=UPI00369057C8
MAYDTCPDTGTRMAVAVKVVIAGGFGVGKTTLVGALSEIKVLRTEEVMSVAGQGIDHLTGTEPKTTTTVAMDFGRITLPVERAEFGKYDVQVMLFGTPGQDRFWFMWDDLTRGALGAIVLADTRRLKDCFPAVEYFEEGNIPFLVAVNRFDGAEAYPEAEVQQALGLNPTVPLLACDARRTDSARHVLIKLVEHAYEQAWGRDTDV